MTDSREARAAFFGLGAVAVYLILVLSSGRVDLADFGNLYVIYLRLSFTLWGFLGIGALLWLLYIHRPRGGADTSPFKIIARWGNARWTRDRMLGLIWPPLLFASLMASFNAFKQMVLPIAGFRYDPLFAALDRALFFGEDPWRLTHAVFSSPAATGLINAAYHGWFVPMALGVAVCAWLPRATYRLRVQYLLSYIAVWIGIGSVLAFLMPAAGPCFYASFTGDADFLPLFDRLAGQQAALGTPLSALEFQHDLLALHGGDRLVVGGGISAMPSVHNALAALFAFAAFGVNRAAGWIASGYALMIWIGSIHLGWHYAIDGLAALPLAWGIWIVAGRIADRLECPLFGRMPDPVAA
jgi:hypothetical protein